MIRSGDKVKMMLGADRGKIGVVLRVLPKAERVIVEKMNVVKRHRKPAAGRPGGIIEREASVHISNVMLQCPLCQRPTRSRRGAAASRRCHRCQKEF